MRVSPSTRFRPHRGMPGKKYITPPESRVGRTKKSPTEKAMPRMTARVIKKLMAFSLPSFLSSHRSNFEGSASASSPSSG